MRKIVFTNPAFTAGHDRPVKFFFFFFSLIFFLSQLPMEISAYPAIVDIVLNQENKGSFFVEVADDGDFLVKKEDFDTLGLPEPETTPVSIDGEKFYPLSQIDSLTYALDEATLTLEISVDPQVLPLHRIDFKDRRPETIFRPREDSFFINYGASFDGNKDDALQQIDLTHELALRRGRALFLSDGIYTETDERSEYTRLLSRMIRDNRSTLRRFILGDHFVLSGPLGSQVLIGGTGYARNFDINPYYINYPSVRLSGAASTPSQVEVYIDGMLVRREEVSPGPFILENITRYEGAGEVEVIIRDAFNQEQRIRHPFYLAENLLATGDHEYSYNIGALREDFGIESNTYADSVFSGFHRYGLRSWLTVGVSAEADPDFFSLAPRVSFKWEHYGYFDFALGASSGTGHNGIASAFEYFYRNRRFSTGLKARYFSEEFARLDDNIRADRPEFEAQLRFGYSTATIGSFNLGFSRTTYADETETRDEINLTCNRRLARNLSMYASINHRSASEDETILIAGLNFTPWRSHQLSARVEDRENSRSINIGVQKDPPVGQGYGYRAAVEASESANADSYSFNAAGQYNGRYAILRAETDMVRADSDFLPVWRASVSGAVARIGGATRPSRPIRDSFTLVKVGDVEGVRVVRNSSVIGETDRNGLVLIPELTSFYDNQIAVRDEDIPIEYGLERSQVYIQPPLRSGSCLAFNATKIQPITGYFMIRKGGRKIPYEFSPLTIRTGDSALRTQTGYNGEFYIDTTEVGGGQTVRTGCEAFTGSEETQDARVIELEYTYEGNLRTFNLAIPHSDALFIDMGELILNQDPPSGGE